MRIFLLSLFFIMPLLMTSCVSKKKFLQMQDDRDRLSKQLADERSKSADLARKLDDCNKRAKDLERDTTRLGRDLRDKIKQLADMTAKYNECESRYNSLKNNSSAETQELIRKLEKLQQNLLDVQRRLAARDSALSALKKRILEALAGFENTGLTVYEKNGRVYVELSDKLLFESGKYILHSEGKRALGKLGEALNNNAQRDIQIQVEGHTDSLAIKTDFIKDNWDLSVLRATEVVRFMTKDAKVDPRRFTASGHAEFFPKATNKTKDGQAMNRRTEIILAPNLEDIFKIVTQN